LVFVLLDFFVKVEEDDRKILILTKMKKKEKKLNVRLCLFVDMDGHGRRGKEREENRSDLVREMER